MGLFSKLAKATRQGIPGRDSGGGMGSAMARPAPPRPTLIQGGPAYFTPEGYTPPIQPEQAFMPTDVMRDPIADMFAAQPPLIRGPRLPKPPIPPRDDQIFIDDMPPLREEPPMDFPQPMPDPVIPPMPNEDMVPFIPPIDIPMNIDRPMIRGLEDRDIMNDFMSIERIDEPRDDFIPRMINEDRIPFIPPVTSPPVNIGGPPLDTSLIPEREVLQRPIIPPRRDDFMFIERINEDPIIPKMINEDPVSFIPPSTPMPMPKLSPLQQAFEKIQNQQMPMQPKMPMPVPIATPTPTIPMPIAPINLPRLELPQTNRIDRQIPMMPRMGGMGRR